MKHLVLDRILITFIRFIVYFIIFVIIYGIYQNFLRELFINRFRSETISLILTISILAFGLAVLSDFLLYIENSISSILRIKKERDSRFKIIDNINKKELLCSKCHHYFYKVVIPVELEESERGRVYCPDCAKKNSIEGQSVDDIGYLKFHISLASNQRDTILSDMARIDEREKQYKKYNISYIGSFNRERQTLSERLNNIDEKIMRLNKLMNN